MKNRLLINIAVLIFLVSLLITGYFYFQERQPKTIQNVKTTANQTPPTQVTKKDFEVIAQDLNVPWEVVFLPGLPNSKLSGEILITERNGNLLFIKNRQKNPITGVKSTGEGGLLGLAVHPDFATNHWIYLYLTTNTSGNLTNQVERYRLENQQLSERKIIIQGISGALYHDGGRIAFGPDSYLYITTGDASSADLAQNINSLNGKILRVKDDGSFPADNPFGNAVYSYGHRNPQGLTWDNKGRLWATEHGRTGTASGLDELNLIEKGKNYGWPIIQGDEKQLNMVSPVIQSGPQVTWAPAGAAFYNGKVIFAGLRGETLYTYNVTDKSFQEYFPKQFGRLRVVVLGPDGYLYITTSNTDGRGQPRTGDDKLIRINPKLLK